jgi:hypothetical protein
MATFRASQAARSVSPADRRTVQALEKQHAGRPLLIDGIADAAIAPQLVAACKRGATRPATTASAARPA